MKDVYTFRVVVRHGQTWMECAYDARVCDVIRVDYFTQSAWEQF